MKITGNVTKRNWVACYTDYVSVWKYIKLLCGDGKVYSVDYIKSEILNILKAFKSYCEEHDLGYMLVYGTLLGAVRHKGFIPWDDDIDVGMLSDDYVKLEQNAKRDPYIDKHKRYKLAVPGDKNYAYSFMKVIDTKYVIREKNVSDTYSIGLYIDIFRIDNWPSNRVKEIYQLKKAHLLLRINEICIRGNIEPGSKYSTLDKLLRPVDYLFRIACIRSEKICKAIDSIAERNPRSGFMGIMNEATGNKKEKQRESIYRDLAFLEFEGEMFPVPSDYDSYLKHVYGDYMKLPEPENRIGHEYDIIKVLT